MTTPPQLTAEQRQAALAKAAEVRVQRAEIKAQIKKGDISLSTLFERAVTDSLVGKMKVQTVLESLPGYGKVKAQGLMDQVGISETRRLQGLGEKQKAELLSRVG
ncbi:MAG: integration host factor, actinobacterial type [Actinomycetota bacterium]|jgi:hypothetical protein|nr:integration host factor, actinobacterial type [Actinomycetota bacterium]